MLLEEFSKHLLYLIGDNSLLSHVSLTFIDLFLCVVQSLKQFYFFILLKYNLINNNEIFCILLILLLFIEFVFDFKWI